MINDFARRIRSKGTTPFHFFAIGVIILFSLALYRPALSMGYLYDDYDIMAAITQPGFTPWAPFPAGTGAYFRPLVSIALYFEQQVAPGNPAWLHHAVNVGNHMFNTILVYALCSAIFSQHQLALLLALLFGVHPASARDVYLINCRGDLQATFFYVLGSWQFVAYLKNGRLRHLGVAGISLVVALFAKEISVTQWAAWVLLVLLWWGWVDPGLPLKRLKTAWAMCGAGFIVSLIYAAAVYYIFYFHPQGAIIQPSLNLTNALEALLTFPILFIFPNHQMLLIHLYRENQWLLPAGVTLGAAILGGSVLYVIRRKAFRSGGLGLLLLGLVSLPGLLLLIVGGVSSRQIYLPIAMLCIGAAFLVRAHLPSVRWVAGIAAAGILLSLPASVQEGRTWIQRDDLWRTLCQEFRQFVPAAAINPHIILFNPPTEIYSNDASRSLYYCQYGQHRDYTNLIAMARLQTEHMQFPEVRLEQSGDGVYETSVNGELDYLLFTKGISAGQSFDTTLGQIDVTSQRPDGYIDGYRVRFLPEVLERSYILFFDGQHFNLLSMPEASRIP